MFLLWGIAPDPVAHAASDFLPGQQWSTWTSGPFQFHFTEAGRDTVARLAGIGRRAWDDIAEWTGSVPATPIHVVVILDNDFANGSAQSMPRNLIRLYPVHPRQPGFLQEYDDWLALLFVHELIHIFHIDDAELPASVFRKIFGRNLIHLAELRGRDIPFGIGFPNALLPDTLIEGYAVWGEGELVAGRGRGNNVLGLTLLRNLARDQALGGLGRATARRRSFPGGNAPRILGGSLHQYGAERRGFDWPAMYRLNARGFAPLLYAIPWAIEHGERPGDTWHSWTVYQRGVQRSFDFHRGAFNEGDAMYGPVRDLATPRFDQQGGLYATAADGRSRSAVVKIENDGSTRRIVERFGGTGLAILDNGGIWLDSSQRVSDTAVVSDLWRVEDGSLQRVSLNLHAFDVNGRSGRIAYVVRRGTRYCVAVSDPPGQPPVDRACGPDGFVLSHPDISADGQKVLFSAWSPRYRDSIYIWDRASDAVQRLTSSDTSDWYPQWGTDNSIWAVRTLDGTPDLYRLPEPGGTWVRVTRTLHGVWQYAINPVDGSIAYTYPDSSGWHLATLAVDEHLVRPVTDSSPAPDARIRSPQPVPDWPPIAVTDAVPYSATRTIAPMGWTPLITWGDGTGHYGATVGGGDVVGFWAWAAALRTDSRGNPDASLTVSRNYGRWSLSGGGDLSPVGRPPFGQAAFRQRGWVRVGRAFRGLDVGRSIAARTEVEGGLHEDRLSGRDVPEAVSVGLIAARDSRSQYTWSLVSGDGWMLKGLVAGDFGIGGARLPDGRAEVVAASGGFVGGDLQWQLQVAAAAHGRTAGPLDYSLRPPADASFSARTFSGRGVRSGGVDGVDRFASWDAELVHPVAWIEAGPGSAPIFFDQANIRGYVAGSHWQAGLPVDDLRGNDVYAGAELGLGLSIAYIIRLPEIRFGSRWAVTDSDGRRDPRPEIYGSVGFTFNEFGRFLDRGSLNVYHPGQSSPDIEDRGTLHPARTCCTMR